MCEYCNYIEKNNLAYELCQCIFCPRKGGAFKKLYIDKQTENVCWAHALCIEKKEFIKTVNDVSKYKLHILTSLGVLFNRYYSSKTRK